MNEHKSSCKLILAIFTTNLNLLPYTEVRRRCKVLLRQLIEKCAKIWRQSDGQYESELRNSKAILQRWKYYIKQFNGRFHWKFSNDVCHASRTLNPMQEGWSGCHGYGRQSCCCCCTWSKTPADWFNVIMRYMNAAAWRLQTSHPVWLSLTAMQYSLLNIRVLAIPQVLTAHYLAIKNFCFRLLTKQYKWFEQSSRDAR